MKSQRVGRSRACSSFARWLGKIVNRSAGWHVAGHAPDDARMLIIAAPHTSNWDFIYLIAAAFSLGLSVHWIGKASLFRWPLGSILRFMGGVPVDRSRRNNLVASLAEEINSSPGCVLVASPEGTRRSSTPLEVRLLPHRAGCTYSDGLWLSGLSKENSWVRTCYSLRRR